MHEAALIEYTLNAVEKAARLYGIQKVTEIDLVVGKLRYALPSLMQSAFRLLSGDTMFEGCVLSIEEREPVLRCLDCGKETVVSGLPVDVSPCCKSHNVKLVQGEELLISSFKGY